MTQKQIQKSMQGQMRTGWNLGLLYKGLDDPAIERDMKSIERAYAAFERQYRGKTDYLRDEAKLARALSDFEALLDKLPLTKPLSYLSYIQDLDSTNASARAKATQLMERFAKNDHRIVFFELSLAKVPVNLQKRFLASRHLSHFRYYLKLVFDRARFDLSEPEEKIMGLKSIPAYQHWVAATEKLLGKQSVEFKGKQLPLPEAMNRIADLPLRDRRALHMATVKALESLSDAAESEINAVVTDKKINDELRGFERPYDATILAYQNDRRSALALVEAVTKHFKTSHRFYRLKAKLLKLPHLEYSDRSVGIGHNTRRVKFEEAVETLRRVFGGLDEASKSSSRSSSSYRNILDRYLENGQIDVFPKAGKTGGAYCSGNINAPTFVLLNYTDTWDQVMTFAHEMGHAIHTELSQAAQPPLYQHYSIAAAEVASTLFESFVFDSMFESLSRDEQVAALHKRINEDVQTIFRQIACFNFEVELHESIRARGGASKEQIRAMMNKHMSSYLGPAVHMQETDGNFFVSWSHIRRFFYVYTYAFGQLISKALYEKYRQDPAYLAQIERFLRAGGSDSPENIFRSIGIDVTKPDFWETGLRSIERDIARLEKLTKNR